MSEQDKARLAWIKHQLTDPDAGRFLSDKTRRDLAAEKETLERLK